MGSLILVLVILAIIFGLFGTRVVPEKKEGVVFRGGKFKALRKPGMVILVPFYDKLKLISYDLKDLNVPQKMTTAADREKLYASGTVTIKMKEPAKAYGATSNYEESIINAMSDLLLKETSKTTYTDLKTVSNKKELEDRLLQNLKDQAEMWGIEVRKVKIILER